jgi:4-hydroxy-3-methylbut-2-enyl diphosphate reductase
MEVLIAKEAGFCYGVKRALSLVYRALKEAQEPLYSLGPLIHNPQVVKELEARGLKTIADMDTIPKGTLVVRSHGAPPSLLQEAQNRSINILDATCPTVKRVQEYAEILNAEGYQVVIIGDKDHPEVKGIEGYAGEKAVVISNKEEINQNIILERIGVVVQTTQSWNNFQLVLAGLVKIAKEIRVFNTLCSSTATRYREAMNLARRTDAIIVVGGSSSANTARLTDLCRRAQPNTFQIESAEDIQPSWLEGKKKIGLTAGASTPYWLIEDVREKLISKFGVKRKFIA